MTNALTIIGDVITAVIGWVGELTTALVTDTGTLKELFPFLMISVGVSALLLLVKIIKSMIWGA